ncbi:hypothetical protein D3C84_900580 [compost metagenome]
MQRVQQVLSRGKLQQGLVLHRSIQQARPAFDLSRADEEHVLDGVTAADQTVLRRQLERVDGDGVGGVGIAVEQLADEPVAVFINARLVFDLAFESQQR